MCLLNLGVLDMIHRTEMLLNKLTAVLIKAYMTVLVAS